VQRAIAQTQLANASIAPTIHASALCASDHKRKRVRRETRTHRRCDKTRHSGVCGCVPVLASVCSPPQTTSFTHLDLKKMTCLGCSCGTPLLSPWPSSPEPLRPHV
jgi:hypothetical protein